MFLDNMFQDLFPISQSVLGTADFATMGAARVDARDQMFRLEVTFQLVFPLKAESALSAHQPFQTGVLEGVGFHQGCRRETLTAQQTAEGSVLTVLRPVFFRRLNREN